MSEVEKWFQDKKVNEYLPKGAITQIYDALRGEGIEITYSTVASVLRKSGSSIHKDKILGMAMKLISDMNASLPALIESYKQAKREDWAREHFETKFY
jgi:hypothetical protein